MLGMSLTQSVNAKLKQLIINHEGYEQFPYLDKEGKVMIGIGYNLTDRGMSEAWINTQYEQDIEYFNHRLTEDFSWFDELSDNRKIVLLDMCFMGYRKFLTFKRMLMSIAMQDYRQASLEILDSRWAILTPIRANTLAKIMLTDVI
jgi:GH24 family phage-related lysozyme (muramidase)